MSLAREYEAAGRPVVFLEQDVYRPKGNRLDRFHDARGARTCGVPWVIVDSGYSVTCGAEPDYASAYRTLVDEALAQPAQADVEAWYERVGDDVRVGATVTNRSGGTIGFAHWATVNAIVWEKAHVVHTDRIVRAATFTELVRDLQDGASETVSLLLTEVAVSDWDRAAVLVTLDYRPEPSEPRFVALQSAVAREGAPTPTASRTATPVPTVTPPRTPTDTATPYPTLPPDAPKIHLPFALRARS